MKKTKLLGSINLARLRNAGLVTIQGKTGKKKCVVIPVEDNDLYIKVEQKTAKDGTEYTRRMYNLGIAVYKRESESTYGQTHYIKPAFSKDFINTLTEDELKAWDGIFLGDMKSVEYEVGGNQASTAEAPVVSVSDEESDQLPF